MMHESPRVRFLGNVEGFELGDFTEVLCQFALVMWRVLTVMIPEKFCAHVAVCFGDVEGF